LQGFATAFIAIPTVFAFFDIGIYTTITTIKVEIWVVVLIITILISNPIGIAWIGIRSVLILENSEAALESLNIRS
jgi:hypothetical protein